MRGTFFVKLFFKYMVDCEEGKDEYLLDIRFDPQECWIFLTKHLQKFTKFVLWILAIKGEFYEVSDEGEHG